jgi:hypothetical protein
MNTYHTLVHSHFTNFTNTVNLGSRGAWLSVLLYKERISCELTDNDHEGYSYCDLFVDPRQKFEYTARMCISATYTL